MIATNEVVRGDPAFPTRRCSSSSTRRSRRHRLQPRLRGARQTGDGDDPRLPGWPVGVGVAAGDLLPLVLPGHDAAVLDYGRRRRRRGLGLRRHLGDPAARASSTATALTLPAYQNAAANSPDQGPVLNLADYPSVGDIAGHRHAAVIKGGLTAQRRRQPAGGQPEPALQPRRAGLGGSRRHRPRPRPGFPRATDDFQLVSQASVARVGPATAPGAQALVGTGLYQLHAYGPGGVEPAGWPKFTGGWIQATPVDRRRGRRRRPRRHDADPRGLVVPLGHRRRRLRRLQRRVVDLPPRRALHRQLRPRRPPAGHARRADRDARRTVA